MAGGVFQQVWFNPDVVLKMKYPARMVGFAATYLVMLAGCSYLGAWMPVDDPTDWIIFVAIFGIIFAIISIIFSIRYWKEGGTYNELIAEYQGKRKDDKHDIPS